MLLIDTDYKGEDGFTVDAVIYAKDINGKEATVKGQNSLLGGNIGDTFDSPWIAF